MPTTKTKITTIEKAYCFRSGQIVFGTTSPEGSILLMPNVTKKVRKQIEVLARHSRVDDQIFIPGVPEADNDIMALNEVHHFIKVIKWALLPKDRRMSEWPKRNFASNA